MHSVLDIPSIYATRNLESKRQPPKNKIKREIQSYTSTALKFFWTGAPCPKPNGCSCQPCRSTNQPSPLPPLPPTVHVAADLRAGRVVAVGLGPVLEPVPATDGRVAVPAVSLEGGKGGLGLVVGAAVAAAVVADVGVGAAVVEDDLPVVQFGACAAVVVELVLGDGEVVVVDAVSGALFVLGLQRLA